MLENVTMDTVLRDHYHLIPIDKLSEDNITIDENLVIEDSSTRYPQIFASFLNDAYYRGYIISESILKKLMDVIDYEGYEVQIFEKYIDILHEYMNDYECDEDNRPKEGYLLEPQEAIDFVTKYCEAIKDSNINIPHYRNPESEVEERQFPLCILNEMVNPLVIYNDIINGCDNINKLIETSYAIYKWDFRSYLELVNRLKYPETFLFLLDRDKIQDWDVLTDNIKSFDMLARCIKSYYLYSEKDIDYPLKPQMVENMTRIINIITMNVPIEQVAIEISKDYILWKLISGTNFKDDNDILPRAVELYENDPDTFGITSPVEYIMELPSYFNHDRYFYARYILLNMDYRLLCNHFIEMFSKISNYLDFEACKSLIVECISGLANLYVYDVDLQLIHLHNELEELRYGMNHNNTVIKPTILYGINNHLELLPITVDIDFDLIETATRTIIDKLLFFRNGKFEPEWLPTDGDDVRYNYTTLGIGESLRENKIFGSVNHISTGSIFKDVRHIECMNPNCKLKDTHLDKDFNICSEESASYIMKFLDLSESDEENFDILLILGADNNEIKIKNKLLPGIMYLIGIYNISNSDFIYANSMEIDDISYTSISRRLYTYSNQIYENLTMDEIYVINTCRTDRDAYFLGLGGKQHATSIIELSKDFAKDKNAICLL